MGKLLKLGIFDHIVALLGHKNLPFVGKVLRELNRFLSTSAFSYSAFASIFMNQIFLEKLLILLTSTFDKHVIN